MDGRGSPGEASTVESVVVEVPAVVDAEPIPYPDGLDHYLVTLDPAAMTSAGGEDRLRLDLESGDGAAVTPGELRDLDPALAEALIQAGLAEATDMAAADVAAHFESLDGVVDAEYLTGGVVALAGDLEYDQVAALPGVGTAVEDLMLPEADVSWEPADAGYPTQWHLNSEGQSWNWQTFYRDVDIDAPEAWDTATGEGVVIAVIDSGFVTGVPELEPALWANPAEVCGNGVDDDANGYVDDCHGYDFYNRRPLDAFDRSSTQYQFADHGVAVASVAASPDGTGGVVGVAPPGEGDAVGSRQRLRRVVFVGVPGGRLCHRQRRRRHQHVLRRIPVSQLLLHRRPAHRRVPPDLGAGVRPDRSCRHRRHRIRRQLRRRLGRQAGQSRLLRRRTRRRVGGGVDRPVGSAVVVLLLRCLLVRCRGVVGRSRKLGASHRPQQRHRVGVGHVVLRPHHRAR